MLEATKVQLRRQLVEFDQINPSEAGSQPSSTIWIYKMFLAQEKALYKTLNMMKPQNDLFIGFFWAPQQQEEAIKDKILTDDSMTKI